MLLLYDDIRLCTCISVYSTLIHDADCAKPDDFEDMTRYLEGSIKQHPSAVRKTVSLIFDFVLYHFTGKHSIS